MKKKCIIFTLIILLFSFGIFYYLITRSGISNRNKQEIINTVDPRIVGLEGSDTVSEKTLSSLITGDGTPEEIQRAIMSGANVNASESEDGFEICPLWIALIEADRKPETHERMEEIIEVLLGGGADPNSFWVHHSEFGATPLSFAQIYLKDTLIPEILIKHGATACYDETFLIDENKAILVSHNFKPCGSR